MFFSSHCLKKYCASICLITTLVPLFPWAYADAVRDIFASDSFLPGEIDEIIQLDDVVLWTNTGGVAADTSVSEEGTRPESGTSYHARMRNGGSITRTFETTARKNIQLKYFWQGDSDIDSEEDILQVYWKLSSDSDFILLETHPLNSLEWSESTITLPAEAENSLIDIRFTGLTNRDEEEARVDDFALEGEIIDLDPPVIAEITPVDNPTNDRSPNITLYTTEGGAISITGHCRSSLAALSEAENTFALLFEEEIDEMHYFKIDDIGSFPDGYFSNCIVTVTDAAGNESIPLSLTPFLVDGTSPEITVEPYNTSLTNTDIIVTASTNEGVLNTTTHTFTENGSFVFTATDAAGNLTNRTVTITNIDKTGPEIILTGSQYMDVAVGTVYHELGATCHDNRDLACDVIVDNSAIDIDTLGDYEVTYSATDDAGNTTTVTRYISVVEVDKPIITLLGSAIVTTGQFEPYDDAGATAFDQTDGDITASLVINNSVNTEVIDTYIITYDVTDSEGNNARQVTRTVRVVDKTGPVLTEETPIGVTMSHTPVYSFYSSELGSITYGGSCLSSTTDALDDLNTITFDTLADGVYDDCTITVTDAQGNSTTLAVTSFEIDSTAPELTQINPIFSPSNDTTPSYIFSSTEEGQITYGGSCSSDTTLVVEGENTITFDTLADGVYDDCTITVTDSVGLSDTVQIPSFEIDTTLPLVSDLTSVTFLPPGVTFTWKTNKATTTRIEYGPTNSYGTSVFPDITPTLNHTATITGLNPRTTYHYRFISTDSLGNVTIGEDATFTTPVPATENVGSSGGTLIITPPVVPDRDTEIPRDLIPLPETPLIVIPPIVPPVVPVTPNTPSPPIPQTPSVPSSPLAPAGPVTPDTPLEGGGVQINNGQIFEPTSVPVDIGGGVVPEKTSYTLLILFLILFGLLNYWWFFIYKRDEEEEEEAPRRRRK